MWFFENRLSSKTKTFLKNQNASPNTLLGCENGGKMHIDFFFYQPRGNHLIRWISYICTVFIMILCLFSFTDLSEKAGKNDRSNSTPTWFHAKMTAKTAKIYCHTHSLIHAPSNLLSSSHSSISYFFLCCIL